MERFTIRDDSGQAFTKLPKQSFSSPLTTQAAIERLAQYEDTGLTPEEIRMLQYQIAELQSVER